MCGPDGRPLDAVYRITYNVVQMRTGLPQLHQVLAGAMRPAAGGGGHHEVRISEVAGYFARTYESYTRCAVVVARLGANGWQTA